MSSGQRAHRRIHPRLQKKKKKNTDSPLMWKMPINPPFYVSYSILYRSFTWSIMSVDWLATVLGMGFINFIWMKIYYKGGPVVFFFFLHSTISVCCKRAPDPNVQWPRCRLVITTDWLWWKGPSSPCKPCNKHKAAAKFTLYGKWCGRDTLFLTLLHDGVNSFLAFDFLLAYS